MSLLDALNSRRLLARLLAAVCILITLIVVLIAAMTGVTLSPETYAFIGAIVGAASGFIWADK